MLISDLYTHTHRSSHYPHTRLSNLRRHLLFNWRIPGSGPYASVDSPSSLRRRRKPEEDKGERTGSGHKVPEDRDCGETGTEEKAQELEPGPKEEREGASKVVFVGEAPQLSFLRQEQMGLVISLVTCIVVELEEGH